MSPPAWRSLTACRPLSAHNGCRSWRAAIIAICWTPGARRLPASWRARDAARSLQEALSAQYPVSIVAIPGPRQHIQAHITLHDGAPLTLDLWPKLPAIARWLPVVLIAQFVLLLACAWYAVRRYCCPSPALPTR